MPEGPECTRVARQLNKHFQGKRLVNVNLISGRYTKTKPVGFENFKPTDVAMIDVKGKFIFFHCSDGAIFNTLGMTGNWKLVPNKYARVGFYFDDDSSTYYCDQRNFGTLKFVFQKDWQIDLSQKLNSIGPDMLNNPCTLQQFTDIFKKAPQHWSLAKFLLEQKHISGVGNIYKSESLFLAAINPKRQLRDISKADIEKLYHAVIKVLSSAYKEGGSTIRNYSDLENNHGKYARFASNPKEMLEARWDNRVMIYGRTTDMYGNPVKRLKLDDGRTTYWSPTIQS